MLPVKSIKSVVKIVNTSVTRCPYCVECPHYSNQLEVRFLYEVYRPEGMTDLIPIVKCKLDIR